MDATRRQELDMRVFLAVFCIVGGLGLMLCSKKFARSATHQGNTFGQANANVGESSVRLGPLLIGAFLCIMGVLVAAGVVQPE
jgi:hypothetical protein